MLQHASSDNYEYSSTLSKRAGYLHCEDVNVCELQKQLVDQFGNKPGASPFFVYSKSQIIQNVDAYRTALEKAAVPYMIGYSVKSNYNRHLISLVVERPNTAVVTVSGHEVLMALSAGLSGDRIIFNGNGKQRWELELAVDKGCLINVDSAFDLQRLTTVVTDLNRPVRIMLRLNPDINAKVHPYLSTGLAKSKFGIDESQIDGVLQKVSEQPLLKLVGLHCHLGSTIDNVHVFRESLEVMLKLADSMKTRGFTDIEYVNLGGGLGIDYRKHEMRTRPPHHEPTLTDEEFSAGLQNFCDRVQAVLSANDPASCNTICELVQNAASRNVRAVDEHFIERLCSLMQGNAVLLKALQAAVPWVHIPTPVPQPADLLDAVEDLLRDTASRWPSFKLIIEPGRSIIGNAATFVTTVLGWKRNGTKRYIVVDGSMTEVIRPALYGAYHHIEQIEPIKQECAGYELFDIVGPVCECGDFLGKDRWMPYPHDGCGMAVFDTGAYCASMASNYNMRSRPMEILVDGSQWQIMRRPETFQDIISTYI